MASIPALVLLRLPTDKRTAPVCMQNIACVKIPGHFQLFLSGRLLLGRIRRKGLAPPTRSLFSTSAALA